MGGGGESGRQELFLEGEGIGGGLPKVEENSPSFKPLLRETESVASSFLFLAECTLL